MRAICRPSFGGTEPVVPESLALLATLGTLTVRRLMQRRNQMSQVMGNSMHVASLCDQQYATRQRNE